MNVTFLTHANFASVEDGGPAFGGSTNVLHLVRGFRAKGHNVIVMTPLDTFTNRDGFVTLLKKVPKNIKIILEMTKKINEVSDVVIIKPGHTAFIYSILTRLKFWNRPKLVYCHEDSILDLWKAKSDKGAFATGLGYVMEGNLKYLLEYTMAATADKIITTQKELKENMIMYYGTEPDKIEVIHYGIDLNLFKGEPPQFDLNKKKTINCVLLCSG